MTVVKVSLWVLALLLFSCAEGLPVHLNDKGVDTLGKNGDSESTDPYTNGTDSNGKLPDFAPQYAELWYSSGDVLVYFDLDESNGTVTQMVSSKINGLDVGQNSLTMLADGSLLGARITGGSAPFNTQFYYIADPPRDGSEVTPEIIGVMPEDIGLEALYTDCEGRLYGMDTGEDDTNAAGNRLLRFTGDYLSGDFNYVVVSDLSSASVADIDDMSPGINSSGEITDNPGFAIDSGTIHDFNFEDGTGTERDTGGDWGIHALGGELFDDGNSRLYILSKNAELFEFYLSNSTLSAVLEEGPETTSQNKGHSGLAGPLTDCVTGFTPM